MIHEGPLTWRISKDKTLGVCWGQGWGGLRVRRGGCPRRWSVPGGAGRQPGAWWARAHALGTGGTRRAGVPGPLAPRARRAQAPHRCRPQTCTCCCWRICWCCCRSRTRSCCSSVTARRPRAPRTASRPSAPCSSSTPCWSAPWPQVRGGDAPTRLGPGRGRWLSCPAGPELCGAGQGSHRTSQATCVPPPSRPI